MVYQSTIVGLWRLCLYRQVLLDNSGGRVGMEELGRLCWYSKVLLEHSVGCFDTAQD